jgi:hypothetical protein
VPVVIPVALPREQVASSDNFQLSLDSSTRVTGRPYTLDSDEKTHLVRGCKCKTLHRGVQDLALSAGVISPFPAHTSGACLARALGVVEERNDDPSLNGGPPVVVPVAYGAVQKHERFEKYFCRARVTF